MPERRARVGRRRGARLLLAAALLGLGSVNLLAYRHAHAMTHFADSGARTPRPEQLSLARKLELLLSGPNVPRPRNDRTPADVGLLYERRAFLAEDGLALEAWLVPCEDARGTLVLFHGYADRKASLLSAARVFHDLGYAALLVDFRGSGGSAGASTSIGYHEALDVEAALRYARAAGLRPPHVLFGVSMGAVAVLRAVGDLALQPDALVLQYPFATLRAAVERRFAAMGLPPLFAPLLVYWGGAQQGFDGFGHNPLAYARSVRAPTLLLQGDRDDRVSMAEAQAIYAALAGEKKLQVFHGLGHVSLLERQSELWTRTVGSFLDGLQASHRVVE